MGAKAYYTLDAGNAKSIPSFVETVTKEHPEFDCLINNAGVQRPFQVLGPNCDFDLGKADQEVIPTSVVPCTCHSDSFRASALSRTAR